MYTTNSTSNTVTDHLRFLTVSPKACMIQSLQLNGRANNLAGINGIQIRMMRMGTASTVGSAASIRPRLPTAPAAVTTAFTAPTIGSTPTLQLAIGFGAGGPGGFTARDSDSVIQLDTAGGANGNIDMLSGATNVSLTFDATVEHYE
jgi:hypothetical protein